MKPRSSRKSDLNLQELLNLNKLFEPWYNRRKKIWTSSLSLSHNFENTHTHTHTHTYIYIYIYIYSLSHNFENTHTHTHIYICVRVCVFKIMWQWIYIYIWSLLGGQVGLRDQLISCPDILFYFEYKCPLSGIIA